MSADSDDTDLGPNGILCVEADYDLERIHGELENKWGLMSDAERQWVLNAVPVLFSAVMSPAEPLPPQQDADDEPPQVRYSMT